ncbi:MAG TPA: hypothetical protein VF544_17535 [Pyrinomonadaceae bacterium]
MAPDIMLLGCVWSIGDRCAGLILQGKLRDPVAAGAVLLVTEAWVIRVELNNRIPIRRFAEITCDQSHINMVMK